MMLLFYTAAAVAILATLMVITRTNVVHALLYFIYGFDFVMAS